MDAKTMGARLVYPMTAEDERDTGIGGWGERGLTLRQHFAGLAIQGLLATDGYLVASKTIAEKLVRTQGSVIAESAVEIADALLAELAKEIQ